MKLTLKESTALAAAELRPTAPLKLLRKESGLREHTLRYALQRLRSRGVCAPLPLINLHRLGYTIFNIFFTIGAQKRTVQAGLLKAFIDAPEVIWVGEFGGEFQYGIAVCAKEMSTALEFIESLSTRFRHVFFDKAVSVQFGTTCFPRRYLSPKKFSTKPLACRLTKQPVEIDTTDARILSVIASPGDPSNRQLAHKLGLPASTVDLRMRRLIERGIIAGHLLAVDCTAYGYQSFKLLVYARGMNADLSAALYRFCEQHPHVTYLIESLGSWDYEIGIEVAEAEACTHVMQAIYEEFGPLLNTMKVLAKFRDLKYRYFPGG